VFTARYEVGLQNRLHLVLKGLIEGMHGDKQELDSRCEYSFIHRKRHEDLKNGSVCAGRV
jgi:hypothetical protein